MKQILVLGAALVALAPAVLAQDHYPYADENCGVTTV